MEFSSNDFLICSSANLINDYTQDSMHLCSFESLKGSSTQLSFNTRVCVCSCICVPVTGVLPPPIPL